MATFERFFSTWLGDKLGEEIGIVLKENQISARIEDTQELSFFHEEANIFVDCDFSSKAQADAALEKVRGFIRLLPIEEPWVMSATLMAQDAEAEGKPRRWLYSGSFVIRYHTKESY